MTSCRRCLALGILAVTFVGSSLAAPATAPSGEGGFVRAVQKAHGAGVDVRFRVLGTPAVGRPTQVETVFGQVTDPAGASVRFSVDPGLRLDSSAGPMALRAGEETRLTLFVVPQTPGLAYVNVFTTQRGAVSSTSIPIQTGDTEGASNAKGGPGRLKEAPDGGKIISMPAK